MEFLRKKGLMSLKFGIRVHNDQNPEIQRSFRCFHKVGADAMHLGHGILGRHMGITRSKKLSYKS